MRFNDIHDKYLSEYPDAVKSKISTDSIKVVQAPREVMEVDEDEIARKRAVKSISKERTDTDVEEVAGSEQTPDGTIPFIRIRRITGYLVGDRNKRFNNAKKAEEQDRLKHSMPGTM